MNPKKARGWLWCLAFLSLGGLVSCNRVLLHAREREMPPVSQVYNASISEVFKAAKDSLAGFNYRIHTDDESAGTIKTSWQSTKASSHYLDLFDRKDYGTVGAYYRLNIRIKEAGNQTEVEVSAPVRSIIGRIQSAHSEEKRVLRKIADLLRREDFEMTNVGVTD